MQRLKIDQGFDTEVLTGETTEDSAASYPVDGGHNIKPLLELEILVIATCDQPPRDRCPVFTEVFTGPQPGEP